jgi:thiamine biosynthesis lipoprotein
MDILREAAKHTDINKVIINETNSTVFLDDAKMSLDVGAVAKGYAVEQVTQVAIKNGFTSGIISVGGNVRAIGNKGNGNNATGNKVSGNNGAGNNGNVNGLWNLGIQNPDKESEKTTINIVYLTDLSLVSSGDYERYYTVNGKRYHHIIDPDTLFPAQYFSAVTIICKDSGIADSLSTAVFNLPFEKGLKYINDLPDTEALWVMKNGEIRYSDDFSKYLKK